MWVLIDFLYTFGFKERDFGQYGKLLAFHGCLIGKCIKGLEQKNHQSLLLFPYAQIEQY